MLDQGQHDAIVSQFYASALGDTPWRDTLGALARSFGSDAAVLRLADISGEFIAAESSRPDSNAASAYYLGEIFSKDPRTPLLLNAPLGSIYYDHLLWNVEEISQNRWCREACAVLGVTYQLGTHIRLSDDLTLCVAILSTEAEGHASSEAIAAFRRLTPLFEQATALGQVIETQTATRIALLNGLASKADGVILLSAKGEPTFVNDAATAILNSGDGLSLSQGAFLTRRPPETRRLQQLVQAALSGVKQQETPAGGRMLVTRPSGRRPYVVSVLASPPTERFLAGRPIGCVIHLQDLSTVRTPARDALQDVFGLTEREADFAIELVGCADLQRAADQAQMSVNTARNHLQSIFRKAGVKGQTELVQLLGRL